MGPVNNFAHVGLGHVITKGQEVTIGQYLKIMGFCNVPIDQLNTVYLLEFPVRDLMNHISTPGIGVMAEKLCIGKLPVGLHFKVIGIVVRKFLVVLNGSVIIQNDQVVPDAFHLGSHSQKYLSLSRFT